MPLRFKRSNATRQARAEPPLCARRQNRSVRPDETPLPRHRSEHSRQPNCRAPPDPRQPIGEIRAMAAPEGHPTPVLAGDEPVPVVLDLMQPARASRRLVDEERATREDETSRRNAPRTPGRDTPQHDAVCGWRGRSCDLPYVSNAKAPRSSFPYCCRHSCCGDDARATGHGRFCGSLVQVVEGARPSKMPRG